MNRYTVTACERCASFSSQYNSWSLCDICGRPDDRYDLFTCRRGDVERIKLIHRIYFVFALRPGAVRFPITILRLLLISLQTLVGPRLPFSAPESDLLEFGQADRISYSPFVSFLHPVRWLNSFL